MRALSVLNPRHLPLHRIAVADIGSNSARMVVMQRSGESGLIPISESKVLLRLQRELGKNGELSPETIQRLISVVQDFDAVARSANSDQLTAVATSAIRNAANQSEIVKTVEEATGVRLRVLTGKEEAEATFKGAVSSLPVREGAVIDIGGGSMEIVRFEDRNPGQSVTVPLGALKLSDMFLTAGDISQDDLKKLRKHVRKTLAKAGIDPLEAGAQLIGTGGTVRNAGKVDRRRSGMRFGRLHGHRITANNIESALAEMSRMSTTELRQVPGLNPERSDSIVGGMAALVATVDFLGSDSLLVSGAGLREGVALTAFGVGNGVAGESSVQSVRDMCARFSTWDAERAARRSSVALRISAAFDDLIPPEIAEAVALAAELVDAGSAIDYYQRYASAALIVLNSNAGSLTHRQIALVSAICMTADRADLRIEEYGGEIKRGEAETLVMAGLLLRLADEIEMRLQAGDENALVLERRDPKKRGLRVSFPGAGDWQPGSLLSHYISVQNGPLEPVSDQIV